MKSLSSISDFFKILNKGEINFSSLENHYKSFNDKNQKSLRFKTAFTLSEFIPFIKYLFIRFCNKRWSIAKYLKKIVQISQRKNVSLVSNGTLSLLLALKAHNLNGSLFYTLQFHCYDKCHRLETMAVLMLIH